VWWRARISLVVAMVVATAMMGGCSRQHTEATLPPGLVCDALDSAKLATLLPAGPYQTNGLLMYLKGAKVDGGCDLYSTSGDDPVLQVAIGAGMGYPQAIDTRYKDCRDPFPIELELPPVGGLIGSGSCRQASPTGNGSLTNQVWVQYWGGEIVAGGIQGTTLIEVCIRPVEDRDNIVDAAHMMQLVLDFISVSYETDPRNPLNSAEVPATADQPSASSS